MAELKILKMSEIQAEPVSWLWEPYIPRGKISLIQGDGGNGKTTLSLVIATAVANGEALPGGFADPPANVIFQTAEDGLSDTIKPRLEQLGADCSRIFVVDESEESLSLSDERIERAIIETNAKLFILDPLQAYLGGSDMNSAKGMRPLMKSLAAVAERTDCAIIIIGHLNKASIRTKSQYRGLGSIDIYAAMRSVLTVGIINNGENMRVIVHNKSNLAPPGVSMLFTLDPVCGFSWQGEYDINADYVFTNDRQTPESQFDRAKQLIKDALHNGMVPAADMERMADKHGISMKTFNRAKSALGVTSVKISNIWYWQMPIEIVFTDFAEKSQNNQHGQDTQNGQMSNMTALTIFNRTEVI